ncbi:MAG: hypothetical protein WCK00_16425 [Deltaproteobacteria bacterium]
MPYAVNDPSRIRELIKMGVDGIITGRLDQTMKGKK